MYKFWNCGELSDFFNYQYCPSVEGKKNCLVHTKIERLLQDSNNKKDIKYIIAMMALCTQL